MPKFKSQERTIGTIGTVNPEPNTYARNNKIASRVFSLLNSKFTRLPRSKFLFWVSFIRNDISVNKQYSDWATGVSLLVESINRPSISFNVSVLNQYNKKRVVQSGLNYSPVTIRLYDTIDQAAFTMFHDYFQYYYGDGSANVNSWNYDIITPEYLTIDDTRDFGFNPPSVNISTDNIFSSSNNYFFERIEVYEFNHKKFNKYSLIHPKISSFTYDDNSYSDMGTPQMISLTVSYEGVVWEAINQEIDTDLLSQSARDLGDFLDVPVPSNFFGEDGMKDSRDSFIKSGLVSRSNNNIFTNPSGSIASNPDLRGTIRNSPFNPFNDKEYQFFSGSTKSNVNFSNISIDSNSQKVFDELSKSSTASIGKRAMFFQPDNLLKKKNPIIYKDF